MSKKSKLADALKGNPELRAKFLTNLTEAAKEAGLSVEDLSEDESLKFLGPISPDDLGGAGPQQIVIIHKSDSDKNETSIVVGGKGLREAMRIARDLDNK